MSYWLIESNPLSLESPSESNDDEEDDDEEDVSDEDPVSESQSECSKEYDDDDFDNKSLEIDEEERHKISAQINPDEDEEEGDDTEEEEKEEVVEKEDSEQEKNQSEQDDHHTAIVTDSPGQTSSDSGDDDQCLSKATAQVQDDGETSMTESAEYRTLDVYGLIRKLEAERQQLFQDHEVEEQCQQYFYNKLNIIAGKLEHLQLVENHSVQTDIARRQLEMEACRVTEAMQEKFGLQEASRLKREARIERLRCIEAEIKSLELQAKKAFRNKQEQDVVVDGHTSERMERKASTPSNLFMQAGDATHVKIPYGVAPGIPLTSNHLGAHNGSWHSWKGHSGLFSTSQELTSVSFNSTNSNSSFNGKPANCHSSTLSLASDNGETSPLVATKVEMVYSLLSMLGTHNKDDISRTLLAMSQSQDNCVAMRQAGCLPLLLQLLHGNNKDTGLLGKTRGSKTARARASAALHNIVHCYHDDKRGRREARTLRLLEQIRAHCDQQREDSDDDNDGQEGADSSKSCSDMDHHPGAAIAALMKLSFDEDYRHAICTLGGLQAIAELLETDNKAVIPMNDFSTTIRRYSCMALTNLTFGDGKNKALLCSMHGAMEALTDQLRSTNEDLIQAAASVLRNLSWRADLASKKTLREIGVVTTLMRAAMTVKKETTLKSILSALWNLSSHCSENKAEICAVEGALQFLVSLLTYKSAAKTLAIIENGGGILRNVSSQIAIREEYRQTLRKHDCLKILLFHLKSPSLTIVSNACGTLWNLSARCEKDQNALRDMGAVSMLRNLVHSRHKMISSGSSAALKNLLTSVPAGKSLSNDRCSESSNPSLHVRKLRALEAELDHNLSETCENVDSPRNSPTEIIHRSESEPRRFVYHLNGIGGGSSRQDEDTRKHLTRRQLMPRNGIENVNSFEQASSGHVGRAGSQDSVGSTHSDISHDRVRSHTMLARSSVLLHRRQCSSLDRKVPQAGAHNSKLQLYKLHTSTDSQPQTDKYPVGSNGISVATDIPGHVSHLSPGPVPQHHHHQHQHHQAWQTRPVNPTAQPTSEDQPGFLHGQSSLTQSAPSHCQAFPNHTPGTPHQQQQSLLERLAKSSSGLSGSCNLNNSITLGSGGLDSSDDYSSHLTLSNTTDLTAEQLVNYSLKHPDESSIERHYKSSTSGFQNIRPGTHADHTKTGLTHRVMNEHNYLKNNLILDETVAVNNRHIMSVTGSNTLSNSTVLNCHRPVPNLVYNHFHTQHDYPHVGVLTPQPHLITSQTECVTNSSVPLAGCSSACHIVHTSNQSLPLQASTGQLECSSHSEVFNTATNYFNTAQNVAHKFQKHQFQDGHEVELNSPPDSNHPDVESSEEENNIEYIQKRPLNYSMHSHDNGRKDNQDYDLIQDDGLSLNKQLSKCLFPVEHSDINSSKESQNIYSTRSSCLPPNTSSAGVNKIFKHDTARQKKDTDDTHEITPQTIGIVKSCSEARKTMTRNELDTSAIVSKHLMSGRESDCMVAPAVRNYDKCAFDHTNVFSEEGEEASEATHRYFASTASRGSQQGCETNESHGLLRMKHLSDTIEGSSLSDRSSSLDSLSSCENHLVHSSVFNKQSTKKIISDEDLDVSSESPPSSPEVPNCVTKSIKDLVSTPKSRNVVVKQSLNFDRMFNPIKSDSFVSFATFDEENKPVNLTAKSQELSLAQSFPRLHAVQVVENFSFGGEEEQPTLTFSTFQKNFQTPNGVQNNHTTNRLCSSRAKTMPTLTEQIAEVEFSSPILSEISEEVDQLEPISQHVMSMNMDLRKDEFSALHQQHQANTAEGKEHESRIFQPFDSYAGSPNSCKMSDKLTQRKLSKGGNCQQEDADFQNGSGSQNGGASISTPEKIIHNSPNNGVIKKSGIPLKMNKGVDLKETLKPSSIPKISAKPVQSSTIESSGFSLYDESKEQIVHMFQPDLPGNHDDTHSTGSESNQSLASSDGSSQNSNFSIGGGSQSSKCSNDGNSESNKCFIDVQNKFVENKTADTLFVTPCYDMAAKEVIQICDIQGIQSFEVLEQPTSVPGSQMFTTKQDDDKERHCATTDTIATLSHNYKQIPIESMLQTSKIQAAGFTDSEDDSDSSRNVIVNFTTRSPLSDPLHMNDVTTDEDDEEVVNLFCRNDSVISVHGENDVKRNTLSYKDQINASVRKDISSGVIHEQQPSQSQSSECSSGEDDDNDGKNECYIEDTTDRVSKNSSMNSFSDVYRIRQTESSSDNHKKPEQSSRYYDSCLEEETDAVLEMSEGEQSVKPRMQKSRLPRAHNYKEEVTHSNGYTGRENVNKSYTGIGLIKSASLEMTLGYQSHSEDDRGSLSTLSRDQSSSENLTSDISNTTEFDFDIHNSPFWSQRARCLTWCHQRQKYQINEENLDYNNVIDTFTRDISPEETEKLLAENVNLIMSVMQTAKMSGSSIDEDLFIENETISLVSNDYTSDTNSEVSVSWSVKSDKKTHLSSAILSRKQKQATDSITQIGPRFVKPETTQNTVQKPTTEDGGVKSVRGRRKPLYPGKVNNTTVTARAGVKPVATNKMRVLNGPVNNNKAVTPGGPTKSDSSRSVSKVKKTPPPKNTNIQVSPKTTQVESRNTNQSQRFVLRRSRSAGPVTTPGKNRTSPPVMAYPNKAGQRNTGTSQPQTNQVSAAKTVTKVGRFAGSKSSTPSSICVPSPGTKTTSDQSRSSSGANVSSGQLRTSPGANTPGNQSKISNASLSNKSPNNAANAKTNNKALTTRSTSSHALSSSAVEKKAAQHTSKIPGISPPNPSTNARSRDSGIPRRKSSGSASSVTNTDLNRNNTANSLSFNKRTSPVNADSKKCTSPPVADAVKNNLSGNMDSNRQNLSGNTNASKYISATSTDLNKRVSQNGVDSGKRISPTSTDTSKRTSPKNTPKSGDVNKMSSPTNAERNKTALTCNTDPSKTTPTENTTRKQNVSRIATLQKKSGNQERSPSRSRQVSSASSSSSSTKLPVTKTKAFTSNVKPGIHAPPNFKTKAATLPNSNLSASKSRTFSERISKSSTYEKISSELQEREMNSSTRNVPTVKKSVQPNSRSRQKVDIFDTSESDTKPDISISSDSDDDHDSNNTFKINHFSQSSIKTQNNSLDTSNDSLENVFRDSDHHTNLKVSHSSSSNMDSLGQNEDASSQIDSRTFRKKKRDTSVPDLDLPNADETCRSTNSINDAFVLPHINNISVTSYKSSFNFDSFIKEVNIIDILQNGMNDSSDKASRHDEDKSGGRAKSIVAQGLKKLFSGRHKDKEKEAKDKQYSKEYNKPKHTEKDSKTKHYKSNGREKKSSRDKREYDFFRSNIKIEPSTTWSLEDSLVDDLENGSVLPIRQFQFRTDTYNSSNATTTTTTTLNSTVGSNAGNHMAPTVRHDQYQFEISDGDFPVADKHMTKTEMLLARRRRTNMLSSQSDDGSGDGEIRSLHAITAV